MQSLVPEPLRSVKSGDEYMQASLVGDRCWGQLFEGCVSCLGCAYPSCLGFCLLGRLCCPAQPNQYPPRQLQECA